MYISRAMVKHAMLILGICGAAIGLNLSVLSLGADDEAQTASESSEVATEEGPVTQETVQVAVDVPVVVPDGAAAPAPAAPAAPAPAAPAATPAPAPPTTAAPAAILVSTQNTPAPSTAPPTTAATTTAAPTTAATPTTAASTTTPGPTTEYLYFEFDGVADEIIVADHSPGGFEFWSVTTVDGWAFMVEKDTANEVEVKFKQVSGGDDEAKIVIERDGGDIDVKKER